MGNYVCACAKLLTNFIYAEREYMYKYCDG